MHRLLFTKLLNNSSSIFSKNSINTFCNVQKYNLQYLNRISQNVFVNNSTSLRGSYSQYTDSEESNNTFTCLAKAYKEHKRVHVRNVFSVLEDCNVEIFSSAQSLLLLQCCGEAIVDKAPSVRSELCDQVWEKLQESVVLDLQHYNKYLEICIENKVKLDYLDFISKMENCRANEETYHLLLQCACQLGDIPQATKIVTDMKINQFPRNERTFNVLVLGNAIRGDWNEVMKVLNTMQTTGTKPSSLTYWYLLRGAAELDDDKEFLKALQIHPGEAIEQEFLKLLHVLGLHGNHIWIDTVSKRIQTPILSKEGLLQLHLLCMHLVHMEQSEAAFHYYKKFASPLITQEESKFSAFLFGEMLSNSVPPKRVIEMMKDLRDMDYTYTIQRLTEIVLKRRLMEVAWELFTEMPCLRPHYFWPILLQAANDQRESGIFTVIKRMFDFGVKPDRNTLEFYIIPHCDTNDPKDLLLRLRHLGFSSKELLTPILSFLLRNHQLAAAENLCIVSGNISIEPEKLIQPLCTSWIDASDSNHPVNLLKRMYSTNENTDCLGKFVLQAFRICKTPANYNHFLHLIKIDTYVVDE